jgi:hypothetical protein
VVGGAEIPAGIPATPVYRFYAAGPNSHFFTLSEAEKNGLVAINPTNDIQKGWALEGVGFHSVAPIPATAATPVANRDQFGNTCPASYYPVFRAYNNRFAFNDSNHRITSSYIDIVRGCASSAGPKKASCSARRWPLSRRRPARVQHVSRRPAATGSALVSEHFSRTRDRATRQGGVARGAAAGPELERHLHAHWRGLPERGAAGGGRCSRAGRRSAESAGGRHHQARRQGDRAATPQTLEFASAIDIRRRAGPVAAEQPNVNKTVVVTAASCTATLSTPS